MVESLIAEALRNYPDLDWHSLPDLESAPDVYTIRGYRRGDSVYPFSIEQEYETREEAERVIRETVSRWAAVATIEAKKPAKLVYQHVMREILREHGKI